MTAVEHPVATIIEQGIIRSAGDFMRLNIIDWNRYKPWESPQHAMDNLSAWFVNRFSYIIAHLDLYKYPDRDDFPGWKHVGDHERIGRLYWNHFKYVFDGSLHFGDQPDFSGVIYHHDRIPQKWPFYGDVGKCSPIAMRDTVQSLYHHTLWISVIDEDTQIILEPLVPKVKND